VYKQAFTALSCGIGLIFALGSASCGPTCPAGQQSCGNSNASAGSSGDAGATGSTSATCDLLTAVQSCMKAYCTSATNPFCSCWRRGYDITTNGCTCIAFDPKKFCDQAAANGTDATTYDCAAASSGVASICVGVN